MVRHPSTGQNLLMTGTDLLNGGTDTPVSQLSEAGQGIMCVKEGIGNYDMWYGVVCKTVRHPCVFIGSRIKKGRRPKARKNVTLKL